MTHFYRRCSKCGANQISDPSLRMHRFPRIGKNNENAHQLMVWAMFCYPNQDWFNLNDLKGLGRSCKVICSKHFDESQYRSADKVYLIKSAIPGLDEEKENVNRAGPSTSHEQNDHDNILKDHNQIINQSPLTIEKEDSSSFAYKEVSTQCCENIAPTQKKILPSFNKKHYNRCKYLMNAVAKLRNTLRQKKKADVIETLQNDKNVTALLEKKISPSMAFLLQGEFQNGTRKLKGRRWTQEQKFMALELFKKSPTTYRLLGRLFCLPGVSTLRNILAQIQLKPGINDTIFKSIRNMSNKNIEADNICILTFDEMSIRKNLWYNSRTDQIEGYQDHGTHGKTKLLATHALVFMLVWIRKKCKQPVAYYLSSDYVTSDRLSALIKEVLHVCLEAGVIIVATVCDMDGVNVKAMENLGSTVDKPNFEFEGHEIVGLPDPPHLLKCFRNLFMKYDVQLEMPIKSETSGNILTGIGVASWKHVEKFYEIDNKNPYFVFAPKLTKRHIQPNGKEKMRVKLAAQIFSHTVASGILVKSTTNELPAAATATTFFLETMDSLFDLINADAPDRQDGKPYKTNMTKSSPHLEFFKKAKNTLSKLEFKGCRRKPPSHYGWIKLINGYVRLWENLNSKYKIHSLATRRINQDPLENLFGCIRANCGSNSNPTVAQFTAGLKTALLSNLRKISKGNCEDDNTMLVENMKNLLSKNVIKKKDSTIISEISSNVSEHNSIDILEEDIESSAETQACAYVCGFIFKRMNKVCEICKKAMLADQPSNVHIFTEFKEYIDGKHSLQYASLSFVACVEKCAELVQNYIILNIDNLKKNCKKILTENVDFKFLALCSEHYCKNIEMIVESVCIILIKRFCILENRKFLDEAAKKSLGKKIKILKNS